MNFKHLFTAFLMLFVFTFAGAQSYVQIGNGTESSCMPYTAWNYSWSKAIYSSGAIGNAISIKSLSFQVNAFSSELNNQKIYVKHSTSSSITGTYENPETSGYTLVFDGNIVSDGQAQSEWIEIPFIQNFEYNGTDNLVVFMKNEHGSSMYNNFYATAATSEEIFVQGNDDAFPTADGWNPYPVALPNVRFNYSSAGPATPQNPVPGENAIHVNAETMLDFDLGATAATYDVYFSANETDVTTLAATAKIVDAATADGAGTYSVDPTPNDELLDSKSTYFWRAVVSDGAETSASPVWAFNTQKVIGNLPYHQDFEGGSDVVFTLMYDVDDSDWFWSDGLGTWNAREGSAYSGDSCAYVSPSFLDQDIAYELRTPRFNMPENAQISFYWFNGEPLDMKNRVAGVDSTYFEASADGGNTWTKLASLSPAESQTAYQQVLLDLSDYAGNNTYLRWVYKILDENSYPQYVFLDNIDITQSEGTAAIQLEIADTDFDNIAIGGANEQEVVITNTGIGSLLEITSVTLPDGFSCDYTGSIPGGQSDTAVIRFIPEAAQSYSGSVVFEINGDFSGTNTISVQGQGVALLSEVYEYFDNTTVGEIPTGWRKIEDPDYAYHFVQVKSGTTGEYNSAPNVLRMYNGSEYEYPLMAILPGVEGFETNQLNFFAVTSASEPILLHIGVMENPYDASTFEVVETITVQPELTKHIVNFDAGTTKPYIAFSHAMNDSITGSIRIDDVEWLNPGSTSVPEPAGNLYPVDNSSNIDIMNNLKLKWSNEGGAPTGYRISIGTNDEANNMVDGLDVGDETAYMYDGELEFGTSYNWKVMAYNAFGDAETAYVWSFVTMADPTITEYPFDENFNAYLEHENEGGIFRYPMGWSLENNLTQNYCWDKLSNNQNSPMNAHSDSIAMHIIGFSFSEPLDDWLFTPPMYMEEGESYELSFWYKTSQFPGDETFEKLEVLMGTDNSSEAMTSEPLFFDDDITVREYTQYTTVFQAEATGNYYLGFHSFSDPYQWITHIDDVSVNKLDIYQVSFEIAGDGQPLEDAVITVNDQAVTTDADGLATMYLEDDTYNYEITADNYYSLNGTFTVAGENIDIALDLTDIQDLAKLGFKVYPNPTNGVLHIDGQGQYSVAVFNAVGQMVHESNRNGATTIDLTKHAEGVYYIKIDNGTSVAVQQLVIE
ncbi:MAG: choice-of-anchor J domain-containing protein [Salinivirgaceae bacterium]|jgi:hypothetical protein|nr:choice-of-anchor J domain-containing protein [Salinivirgaceae bacterium]